MNDQVRTFVVPPVVKAVTVRCPPEKAFRLFTADLAAWWPLHSHHVAPDPETCGIEGRVGGRLYERAKDGAETVWGRVAAWEPPHRLAFTWHPGKSEEASQRIEVTFAPAGSGTRVELVHSGWEKLGEKAAATRESYDKGWATVFVEGFGRYADRE